MSNIIVIGGAMRTGKTRAAAALARRHQFNHVQTDHFILALQQAAPQLRIGAAGSSYDELCDAFSPVLRAHVEVMSQEREGTYIVEGYYIRPRDIQNMEGVLAAVFIGYEDVPLEALVRRIREHAAAIGCYTQGLTDEKLYRYVNKWQEQSRLIEEECRDRNIAFVRGLDGAMAAIEHVDSFLRHVETSDAGPLR